MRYSYRPSLVTLGWVLGARVHSPRVQLQYGLAVRARSLFTLGDLPSVFAIVADASVTEAYIVTDPSSLTNLWKAERVRSLPSILRLRPGDHLPLSSLCPNTPTITLYAHLAHPSLPAWLDALSSAADGCAAATALRFAPPLPEVAYAPPRAKPPLQAFTAHITLRSTEYKVVDDRVFSTRLFPDCPPGFDDAACTTRSDEKNDPFSWPSQPVIDSEMTYTPAQAVYFVTSRAAGDVGNAIEALALFAEDAPSVTRSAFFSSNYALVPSDEKEIFKSTRRFRSIVGDKSAFLLNGFQFDINALRQGADGILQCVSTLTTAAQHFKLIASASKSSIPPIPRAKKAPEPRLRVLLPVGEVAPNAVVWLNNMYVDSRYKRWPSLNFSDRVTIDKYVANVEKQRDRPVSDTTAHLRLVKVRAHLVSLLLIIDPGDSDQLPYISVPESVVRGDLPIRVAVVLVPNSRASRLAAAVFYHFLRVNGRKTAVQFLGMLRQVVEYFGGGMRGEGISENIVDVAFRQIVTTSKSRFNSPAKILDGDPEVVKILDEAYHLANNMRLLSDLDPEERSPGDSADVKRVSMLCIMNGIVVKDVAREVIASAILEQQRIASLLANGALDGKSIESMDTHDWVSADDHLIVVNNLSRDMRSPDPGRSSMIRPVDEVPRMLAKDIVHVLDDVSSVNYLQDVSGDKFHVTVWLAGEARDTEKFLQAKSILEETAASNFAKRTGTRFAIIDRESRLHEKIVYAVPQPERENGIYVINGRRVAGSSVESVADFIVEVASEFQRVDIPQGVKGDLRLFYRIYEQEIGSACAREQNEGRKVLSQSDILNAVESSNATSLCALDDSINFAGDTGPPMTALAVIDPVEKNAFIMVSLLRALRAAFTKEELAMGIVIVPAVSTLKMRLEPPKTFYKFLLFPDDLTDKAVHDGPFATRLSFNHLPQQAVLTVAVEPPRAWFVSSYTTNYDMDNVILNNVKGTYDLFTEYELKNLIVEGSCIDEEERPPQGLKLILSNDNGVLVDTLVMANLGYFQLKVPIPGMWWLSLARGASSRIFKLRAMEMYKDGGRTVFETDSNGRVPIPVESLSGAGGILLRVVRKPGMEGKSVLERKDIQKTVEPESEKNDTKSVMDKFKERLSRMFLSKSSWSEGNEADGDGEFDDDTINVFSVASGHLYERFLKIMISSVTKHASRKVKFWLLENYLSPSFKKLLPEFAKEFGAEVGMVTYRWPGWLRAQTEKQRIIWAYKILFLDVLFPLNVKRIIFVDSDQVIRGDIAELMDIDLKGAPYGYVPFCDSREEVEGYRFWKTGFWKETLGDSKYHISALYVVDLNTFRETAAGDTLRYIYQSLSADPNSLSNLDQDLPNYASVNTLTGSMVPIVDLPQEWLWCESWCDDESKKSAKAIDLCNNPMTKEPKLDSAKRIISEWVDLDNNASHLTERIYKRLLGQQQNSEFPFRTGKDNGETDNDNVKTEL